MKDSPLSTVFNILNGNNGHHVYTVGIISDDGAINYPAESAKTLDTGIYGEITDNIKDSFRV